MHREPTRTATTRYAASWQMYERPNLRTASSILVFTVPSGRESLAAISRWLRPLKNVSLTATPCSLADPESDG